MDSLSIFCDHCGPEPLLQVVPSEGQDKLEWRKAWKSIQAQFNNVCCTHCGCRFSIEDDGVDAALGGGVRQVNVSPPSITSMTKGSGSRTGGEALYINGVALDVGTLVVKFGGKPAQQVTNRTSASARVVTPVGQYTMSVDEFISGTFIVGESVRGIQSNAKGVVRSLSPFVLDHPTREFHPSEELIGIASSARLRLTHVPYSGVVDVTVENEHGQRLAGGTLVGGFTYA